MTYSQLLIQVTAGEAGILGKKELVTVSLFTSVFTFFFSSMNTKFFKGVMNDTFCLLSTSPFKVFFIRDFFTNYEEE